MKLLKAYSIGLLISLLFLTVQAADTDPPDFKDYPAENVYTGKVAETQYLTKRDKEFESQVINHLGSNSEQPINFAGEYRIVESLGCGSGCFIGVAVSHKTGKILWLPGEGYTAYGKTNWDNGNPLTYRKDSNLLAIYAWGGVVGDKDVGGMVHYYSLNKDKGFVYIKSLPH